MIDLKSFSYERDRRIKSRNEFDALSLDQWNEITSSINSLNEKEHLDRAFVFAKKLNYQHPGLNSSIYFSHPLRVATLSMLSVPDLFTKTQVGVVGLIHNVYELSNVTYQQVSSEFGQTIAENIKLLTVNRKLQWDKSYKKEYYDKINTSSISLRVVKIIDKLDNLFLIVVNPDAEIRAKYIAEIEDYILPMVKKDIPAIYSYMVDLIADNKSIGFIKI